MTSHNINHLDEHGKSPLFIACDNGLEEIVKELLQKKVSVQFKLDKFAFPYKTLVDVAACKGYLSILNLLLDHGIKGSSICLFEVIDQGYPEIFKLLYENHVNLHAVRDHCGNTLLGSACYIGNIDIVHFLLLNGAKINEQNEWGETPLFNACSSYVDNSTRYDDERDLILETQYLEIISLLLEKQADVHVKNKIGYSVTFMALLQTIFSSQIIIYF
mmetsp:Transcript_4983/g.7385  ORF Transcript_4983/g.7385 Transcript_4983/m.7385 type:complete len:217 (-) Transcript_4983:292-942(-)